MIRPRNSRQHQSLSDFKFTRRTSGFTIIEVLIVLAIAGLILVVVFFAVTQLQRNQRDNQRHSNLTRLKAELETFAANNLGTYPFAGVNNIWTACSTSNVTPQSCYDWYNRYITGKVKITDPSTGGDAFIMVSNLASIPAGTLTAGDVYIGVGDKCVGDTLAAGALIGSATSRQYAVLTVLDRNNTYYCIDNG